jgi:hypothetical protein
MRTRVKPAFCHSASSLRYSPLRPRTTGASRKARVPSGKLHHPVDHLAHRLRANRQASGGRIGHADPRPQQAHIVVDLGDGGDGRARVAAGRLLLDGDSGREAVDMLDIGLLHHLEELARIGGQRLDIAPLPLRHRWCRRPARFAGPARQAGDARSACRAAEIVSFDPSSALEVMLARAAHRFASDVGGDTRAQRA